MKKNHTVRWVNSNPVFKRQKLLQLALASSNTQGCCAQRSQCLSSASHEVLLHHTLCLCHYRTAPRTCYCSFLQVRCDDDMGKSHWSVTCSLPPGWSLPVHLSLHFHDDLEHCALLPATSMCFQLGWSRTALSAAPSTWLLLSQHHLCVQGCTRPAGPSLTVQE